MFSWRSPADASTRDWFNSCQELLPTILHGDRVAGDAAGERGPADSRFALALSLFHAVDVVFYRFIAIQVACPTCGRRDGCATSRRATGPTSNRYEIRPSPHIRPRSVD